MDFTSHPEWDEEYIYNVTFGRGQSILALTSDIASLSLTDDIPNTVYETLQLYKLWHMLWKCDGSDDDVEEEEIEKEGEEEVE